MKARMIAIWTWIALSLLRTGGSMDTPCSVNAETLFEYLSEWSLLEDITDCDILLVS